MALASLVGLITNVYRDNALVTAAFRGNDLVTFVVAVPLLVIAGLLYRRSPRMRLVWFGLIGYSLYNYAFYLFGAHFNELFIVYVALVVASVATLVIGLPRLPRGSQAHNRSDRIVAAFLLAFGCLIGGLWLVRILLFVITGDVPDDIVRTDHPTAVVYALDLSILVPAVLTAAFLLWTHHALGRAIAMIVCVKATTYALALIAMSYFAERAGVANAWELTPLWAALGAGAFACLVALSRSLATSKRPSAH